MSTATLGHVQLLGTMGKGRFATVYRAWDAARGQEVAVKLFHPYLTATPAVSARALAEVRAIAAVRHPNLVAMTEAGEDDGRVYLTMELVTGESPAAALPAERALPPGPAVAVLRGVAEAVAAVHAAGLVHGNINRGSVRIDASGRVVLMDPAVPAIVEAAVRVGGSMRPALRPYLAPEQTTAAGATRATDVYALGVLAHELLLGQPPVPADARDDGAHRSLGRARADVPAALARAVQAALDRDPAHRPPDAAAFARLVRAAQVQGRRGGRSHTATRPARKVPGAARRWMVLRLGASAAVAALLAGAVIAGVLADRRPALPAATATPAPGGPAPPRTDGAPGPAATASAASPGTEGGVPAPPDPAGTAAPTPSAAGDVPAPAATAVDATGALPSPTAALLPATAATAAPAPAAGTPSPSGGRTPARTPTPRATPTPAAPTAAPSGTPAPPVVTGPSPPAIVVTPAPAPPTPRPRPVVTPER
jgi:hypothetical protein